MATTGILNLRDNGVVDANAASEFYIDDNGVVDANAASEFYIDEDCEDTLLMVVRRVDSLMILCYVILLTSILPCLFT